MYGNIMVRPPIWRDNLSKEFIKTKYASSLESILS